MSEHDGEDEQFNAADHDHEQEYEPHVIGFDTIEQAFEYMARAEEEARKHITPWQQAIIDATETVYVSRIDQGIAIIGEVWSLQQAIEDEGKYYDTTLPEDRMEYEATVERLTDSRQRGYVFGRWYSVLETEGELGSAHVASLHAPLTKIEFDNFLAEMKGRGRGR